MPPGPVHGLVTGGAGGGGNWAGGPGTGGVGGAFGVGDGVGWEPGVPDGCPGDGRCVAPGVGVLGGGLELTGACRRLRPCRMPYSPRGSARTYPCLVPAPWVPRLRQTAAEGSRTTGQIP